MLLTCRICRSSYLECVIDLGVQRITSRWPVYGDMSTPATPVRLALCRDCGLVQLMDATPGAELYEHDYGYRSGISNTMRQHLLDYKNDILARVAYVQPGDIILDIGSNDATLLNYYDAGLRRIGCDPTGKQFIQFYGEGVELIPTYFTEQTFKAHAGADARCQIVSSISMFYDLPDPVQFARDIHACLADDGIWTCEQSYLLSMLRTNSIDTICHEHIEYYALTQVKRIADMAGFKIIHISFNDCNGGSFRVYFAKSESQRYTECTELIEFLMIEELSYGIHLPETYRAFMEGVDDQVAQLKFFLRWAKSQGKRTYIYGASTKGNCLLQYAGIGESDVPYAVERNLSKVGKMTATGIPIISEETMRAAPPEFLLVLPWHFKDEILVREDAFLTSGGQILFPLPTFSVVSKRAKVVVTGASGMIGSYLMEDWGASDSLYPLSKEILHIELELSIRAIKPDVVIHLAGISSASYATRHPLETLEVNGMLTAQLCEIVYRLNLETGRTCKLFCAGSSEIFKGFVDYRAPDDIKIKNHIHPYSIAKAMAMDMVTWYNTGLRMPFTTGVLFTIESNRKRPEFLLNKVAAYLRARDFNEPLIVGPLDSYRNIIHARDCVAAIRTIVSQPADHIHATYNICGTTSYLVEDLIRQMIAMAGVVCGPDFICVETGRQLIHVCNERRGFDSEPTHITGSADRLTELDWVPSIDIHTILEEILAG